jgi:GTP-binding protein EngB required for normal cell division
MIFPIFKLNIYKIIGSPKMKKKPSLLIIGNSNVGKSSITKLLLPNPKLFKGKAGKTPGSTLLIKPIDQPNLPYCIVDLPGFGYMKHSSRRREEHIKKQIVGHIENNYKNYFLGLLIISILRIEDEIEKYFIANKETIPLSFELIKFLKEFDIPIIVILNKIDKLSNFDKNKAVNSFIYSAGQFGLKLVHLDSYKKGTNDEIPYLEFSALKKFNLTKLRKVINNFLQCT